MSTVAVYEQGAVAPMALLNAKSAERGLIIVLAPSAHAQRMRPFFDETTVAVYDLTDPELAERVAKHEPDGITTFSEPMLPPTAELAAKLGLHYPDPSVIDLLTSKDSQRNRLREAGIDPTRSVRITSVDEWDGAVEQVGLPAVVKPVRGVSSRSTVLVDDPVVGRRIAGELLAHEDSMVVEEYLHGIAVPDPFGDYLSIETVVQQGVRTHLAVTGKLRLAPPFRECGQFWPPRLDQATTDDVLALTDKAIEALGVPSGILHTEVKLTPEGPRIIEVNGRVGGYIAELAAYAADFDLVDAGLRIAVGEPVEVPVLGLDRVYFQFTTPAPVERGVVARVCDATAVRAIPGVTQYQAFARAGTAVGGFGTQDLNIITGEVPDHAAVAAVVDMIMDRVEYRFDFQGLQSVHSARDLVYPTNGRGQ